MTRYVVIATARRGRLATPELLDEEGQACASNEENLLALRNLHDAAVVWCDVLGPGAAQRAAADAGRGKKKPVNQLGSAGLRGGQKRA